MKKLIYTFLLGAACAMPSLSQNYNISNNTEKNATLLGMLTEEDFKMSNASMNLQLFSSASANFVGDTLDNTNFNLNRVRLEIKGHVDKWIDFHYRQQFNKHDDPFTLDNLSSSLELAFINLHANDALSFRVGKQYINMGGYEYYANAILIREFSEFNNRVPCYQAGVSTNLVLNKNHDIAFQVANNRTREDEKMYASGLPEDVEKTKVPFIYTFSWNGYLLNQSLELHYATSLAQQAKKKKAFYVTMGNTYTKGPLATYLDIMYTHQQIDQQGYISEVPTNPLTAKNTEYLTFIVDIDYRIHQRWNVCLKGAYETSRVYKTYGDYQKGLYRRSWNIQSSVEFFPFKKLDLFVFAHYTYRKVIMEDIAKKMGGYQPATQRASLGVIYTIPIF